MLCFAREKKRCARFCRRSEERHARARADADHFVMRRSWCGRFRALDAFDAKKFSKPARDVQRGRGF